MKITLNENVGGDTFFRRAEVSGPLRITCGEIEGDVYFRIDGSETLMHGFMSAEEARNLASELLRGASEADQVNIQNKSTNG